MREEALSLKWKTRTPKVAVGPKTTGRHSRLQRSVRYESIRYHHITSMCTTRMMIIENNCCAVKLGHSVSRSFQFLSMSSMHTQLHNNYCLHLIKQDQVLGIGEYYFFYHYFVPRTYSATASHMRLPAPVFATPLPVHKPIPPRRRWSAKPSLAAMDRKFSNHPCCRTPSLPEPGMLVPCRQSKKGDAASVLKPVVHPSPVAAAARISTDFFIFFTVVEQFPNSGTLVPSQV